MSVVSSRIIGFVSPPLMPQSGRQSLKFEFSGDEWDNAE